MLRIAFRLPADEKEKVLDALMPLLPTGIREEALEDGSVELASVGTAATLPSRKALEAAAGRTLAGFETGQVPADWRARRARYGGGSYVLGGRLVVRSPWDPPAPAGMLEVVIERTGNAFGSGSHPTTQMCLGLLLDIEPQGGAADFGCGVGVLAITAAKLGWAPVSGLDREEPAIEEAHLNARRNGVEADFAHADVATAELPIRELLMANAPPPVHERLAAAITPQVRHVIVSGIVEGELEEVRSAYAEAGLYPRQGMAADSWVAMRLGREDG